MNTKAKTKPANDEAAMSTEAPEGAQEREICEDFGTYKALNFLAAAMAFRRNERFGVETDTETLKALFYMLSNQLRQDVYAHFRRY